MYISELRIENFRMFGEGNEALILVLRPGLTTLVGENDTGKTTVIDALRFALGTRDQEFCRVEDTDFHLPNGQVSRRTEIRIRCKFEDLSQYDKGAFAEHLTYEERDAGIAPVIFLNWKATATPVAVRNKRYISVELRSGKLADGPQFDQISKKLLCATYLLPLRDAEREMSSGRGSRLSQILQNAMEINSSGDEYDPNKGPPVDLGTLSVRGIGDLANALLGAHKGVKSAAANLNTKYLQNLSFSNDTLEGYISVSGTKGDPATRLRALLEKLELQLGDGGISEMSSNRGLGSNNILFMACELLLLGSEEDGFPLLLIEEPEAHLHPQRQLRLMQFLQEKVAERCPGEHGVQIIISTHSPNLASVVELDNLVLMQSGKAFPLSFGNTELDKSDYAFLARFLDVTKANLFFARGLFVVEGDAENILIPTLAALLGRDLGQSGVSIVNVGGTGLRRFARIFLRKAPETDGIIEVPVACIADLDVMPNCAPEIVGKVKSGDPWPELNSRNWRAKKDFKEGELDARRESIRAKVFGQRVETFVADEWTLEYDLAYSGFAREVWIAAHLALADDRISAATVSREVISREALKSYDLLERGKPSKEELASRVYALFTTGSRASKAITAQYLSCILTTQQRKGRLSSDVLRQRLPHYITAAIDHVTTKTGIDFTSSAKA